jgi:hypothetical protein
MLISQNSGLQHADLAERADVLVESAKRFFAESQQMLSPSSATRT